MRPSCRTCAMRRLPPIPSIWGHRAGNPQPNPPDAAFIKAAVRDLLDN